VKKLLTAGSVCAAAVLAITVAAPGALADVAPEHAINVCQSASFYQNFDSATQQPVNLITTLYYGKKVGHTPGAQPVYDGWAATFDYGPQIWGYMELNCIGGYNSW
jgi:opacity protein-like surface antigen